MDPRSSLKEAQLIGSILDHEADDDVFARTGGLGGLGTSVSVSASSAASANSSASALGSAMAGLGALGPDFFGAAAAAAGAFARSTSAPPTMSSFHENVRPISDLFISHPWPCSNTWIRFA